MGIILLVTSFGAELIAQGGIQAIYSYLVSSLDILDSLAKMYGGNVHVVCLDEPAWNDYQSEGIGYLNQFVEAVNVV